MRRARGSRHHRPGLPGSRQTRCPASPVRAFANPRRQAAAAMGEPAPTSACPRAMTTPRLVAGRRVIPTAHAIPTARPGQGGVGGLRRGRTLARDARRGGSLRVIGSDRRNRGPLKMTRQRVGGPPLTAPPLRPGVSHRRAHSLHLCRHVVCRLRRVRCASCIHPKRPRCFGCVYFWCVDFDFC